MLESRASIVAINPAPTDLAANEVGFMGRDRDFAAVQAPDPRALDLATVESDPSPRSAPTVRPPRRVATVARPAGRLDIRLHHRAERLDPRRKAEPIEARSHFRKRFV